MTKKLTIRDEAYKKLLAVKGTNESFSELFSRLVEEVGSTAVPKKLRGSLPLKGKQKLLLDLARRREERRTSSSTPTS